MPAPTKAAVVEQWAHEYAQCISEGHPLPDDKQAMATHTPTVTAIISEQWGVNRETVVQRLKTIKKHKLHHIVEDAIKKRKDQEKPKTPDEIASDAIERHRLQNEIKRLKAENSALLSQISSAQDFSAALAGLSDPLEPVTFQQEGRVSRSGETVVLFLSDLQWGELIDLGIMDGLNAYDTEIARARLKRVFQTAIQFMTDHWPSDSPAPERIILVLGGDMISGEIHEELAKTNTLLSIPALRDCAAYICAGIRMLREAVDCPIDIISVPGNHGRMTRKTESKLYAAHSFDTLLADLVELEFSNNGKWPKWFRMFKPMSGDALIWIYGYRFLITHGDRIGSRGGAGFVGTAATVARGFKKLVMDYAGRSITLDFIMCGHFHTALQLEEGICNGSLPGPSEYSRDLRFRPRPCVQAFLTVHPRHAVTQLRWINAGHPSEGELYTPKSAPADGGKPRFRIPAIGAK